MRIDKQTAIIILFFAMLLNGCGATTQAALSQPHIKTNTPVVLKSTPTAQLSVVSTPASTVAQPTQLIIPAIGVNADIENVGIAGNGDLATPTKNPWDGVGWYTNGPRPGETGSAVIDGHLDRPGGTPAVFWNLRALQAGDEVIVRDTQGKTTRFRVTRVAAYSPQQAPVQEIFGATDGKHLNLITCAGTWVPSQHQTTLRLVVYTIME